MLTEGQTNRAWEKMVEAEVRSLYFADLASRYTRQKQIVTGISFVVSSGAAATIAAKVPNVIPILLSSISALCMAYSIAVGLDRKAATMAKLHTAWNRLEADYHRLWNRWYEDGSEGEFEDLLKRGREASELGAIEAPYNEALLTKWQERVYDRYRPAGAIA